MNIIQKLLAAVRNWRWFGRVENLKSSEHQEWRAGVIERYKSRNPITDPTLDIPAKPPTEAETRAEAVRMLDHRISNLRELIAKNKRQKKAWLKHEATLKGLFQQRAKLTGTL